MVTIVQNAARVARIEVIQNTPGIWDIAQGGQMYRVRNVAWNDTRRQCEYQRLRKDVFVDQLGWQVPTSPDGGEYDRYDVGGGRAISVYCVYGVSANQVEHLLGGVRIFTLRTWDDSMISHEFSTASMVPTETLVMLRQQHAASRYVELTRLCVRPGRWFVAADSQESNEVGFDLAVARDLTYAAAFYAAEQTGRRHAIGLTDSLYERVMRLSRFQYESVHSQRMHTRHGYALVLIDLAATIREIRAASDQERADRMLALCRDHGWVRGVS